ncbi:hypothetical protein CASFOL_008700 [Castilleja foliolosa]|uniref:FRIGIDA-like protein n=1 Tax=Castilleja foliolosa TaxID=1961234 RepID=A0ABD3E196_9LAMI
MEKLIDDLSERTGVAENLLKFLRRSFSEIESRQRNLDLARESVVERMMEIEFLRESYEKGLKELEDKELDFCAFREGKKRKLALEEEELSSKREELLTDVRIREEKLDEHLSSLRDKIECLDAQQKSMQMLVNEKLKEIESQEECFDSAWDSLAERERKLNRIITTLYKRVNSGMERDNVFVSTTVESKMSEIVLKEEQLRLKWQEFVAEVKLADERFIDKVKLRERLQTAENKLESAMTKIASTFKELESRESLVLNSVALNVQRIDFIGELMEQELKEFERKKQELMEKELEEFKRVKQELMDKELEEFERAKQEFHSYREDEMCELALKERQLNNMIKEIIKDAKFRDKQLSKRERLGNRLVDKLNLAYDEVVDLKETVRDRFRKLSVKEVEVESVSDWVEKRMDELDCKEKVLQEKEKILFAKEDKLVSKEKELVLKENNLESWRKRLEVKQSKADSAQELNEKWSQELECKEKSVNSVKELNRKLFKEHCARKKQLLLEKDLIARRARDLDLNESVELKFIVRMDGKNLQMFLNDPEKDLESMGDEIFKVLHLSSDPAKLVLDAMVGFYPPHLRKGDVEVDVKRTCIILLQQLIRITKKIQPAVEKEATELACSWKSKMGTSGENPLEVLGFLYLLAAYNLASCFDNHEIFNFLAMLAQHTQGPLLHLCHNLGLGESITDTQIEELRKGNSLSPSSTAHQTVDVGQSH